MQEPSRTGVPHGPAAGPEAIPPRHACPRRPVPRAVRWRPGPAGRNSWPSDRARMPVPGHQAPRVGRVFPEEALQEFQVAGDRRGRQLRVAFGKDRFGQGVDKGRGRPQGQFDASCQEKETRTEQQKARCESPETYVQRPWPRAPMPSAMNPFRGGRQRHFHRRSLAGMVSCMVWVAKFHLMIPAMVLFRYSCHRHVRTDASLE